MPAQTKSIRRRSMRCGAVPNRYQSVNFKAPKNTQPSPEIEIISKLNLTPTISSEVIFRTPSPPATPQKPAELWMIFAWDFGEVDINALRKQLSCYGTIEQIRIQHCDGINKNKADISFTTMKGAVSALRAIRIGKFYDFGITSAEMVERPQSSERVITTPLSHFHSV